MSAVSKIVYFFIDMILPLFVGYIISRKTDFKQSKLDFMLTMNIFVFFPLTSVLSFWIIRLNMELIWLPVIGIIMQVIPGLLGFLRVKNKYSSPLDQGGYILSTMLSNRGIVGGLSVFILFGETGYAYCRLLTLFASIVFFMFCFPLAQYFYGSNNGKENKSISLKPIFFSRNQIPLIGIAVGFVLNIIGVQRPVYFNQVFDVLIHIVAWFAVVPIGFSMNFGKVKKYWKDIFDYVWIKFLITPVIVYFLARLVIQDTVILAVIVILSLAPTAINAVMASKIHKLNIHLAISAFITTTTVYLFIIYPIIFFVVEYIYG